MFRNDAGVAKLDCRGVVYLIEAGSNPVTGSKLESKLVRVLEPPAKRTDP